MFHEIADLLFVANNARMSQGAYYSGKSVCVNSVRMHAKTD